MKEHKCSLPVFSDYDIDGIQSYLEEMARKGWLLEKISTLWHFRRIEPKNLHFAVTYFPDASNYDKNPTEEQMQFREFCGHAGWKFAASQAQMQIFYNEAPDPVPIETDAALTVEIIHKTVRKSQFPSWITSLISSVMVAVLQIERCVNNPVAVLSSAARMLCLLICVLIIMIDTGEITAYYHWRHKAKKAAKLDGSFYAAHGHRKLRMGKFCVLVFLLLMLLCTLVGWRTGILWIGIAIGAVALGVLIRYILKRKMEPEAFQNVASAVSSLLTGIFVAVTVAFAGFLIVMSMRPLSVTTDSYLYKTVPSGDPGALPLKVEDLQTIGSHAYSYEWDADETFLLARCDASQRSGSIFDSAPYLDYTIVDVKYPALYGWCKESMIAETELIGRYVEVDAAPWGADAVYQASSNGELDHWYLICRGNRIVELRPSWELTPEQIATAAERLIIA